MCSLWTATAGIFRWPEIGIQLSYPSFRWPEFSFSFSSAESLRWLNFWVVDTVLWTVVTAIESLALAALLCFFFTFCGCSL